MEQLGRMPEYCPCRVAEPYSSTHDLERLAGRPEGHPGHAGLLQVSPLVIRCQHCGARWIGLPLPGGGIYGDTRWDRVD